MFHQGDRIEPCLGGGPLMGGIAAEQHGQGCRQLLRAAAASLPFEGMPVAVADAELALQRLRQIRRPCRP
jgi:hypothetical protein